MRRNSAGCLTGIVAAFSRIMLLMFWISRPVAWNATFGGIIVPCLGFLFLPVTTMIYAWLVQGAGGITGVDWLWLGLGVVMDLATFASAGYANREYLPSGQSVPVEPKDPMNLP